MPLIGESSDVHPLDQQMNTIIATALNARPRRGVRTLPACGEAAAGTSCRLAVIRLIEVQSLVTVFSVAQKEVLGMCSPKTMYGRLTSCGKRCFQRGVAGTGGDTMPSTEISVETSDGGVAANGLPVEPGTLPVQIGIRFSPANGTSFSGTWKTSAARFTSMALLNGP
jgi:hypothetical protein